MFDAKQLLNSLLGGGSQAADAGASIVDNVRTQGAQLAGQAGSAMSGALAQAQDQLKGTTAGNLLDKATSYASANPGTATAVGAGLAAILLGTSSGRAVTGDAAKLGGLAMLGGLAYKAFQNYQSGQPLTSGIPGLGQLTAPPANTPYHEASHTQDSAQVILRAMVAAAAADGHVDADERARLLQSVKASGVDGDATAFIEAEMAKPASVADIAGAVGSSPELAAQVYAGARLATASTSPAEASFLAALAKALPLPAGLVARIDTALASQAAAAT